MLEVDDLAVSYGGVNAVDGVSLEVRKGSLVGLIGPNGAGKTTLIDAVTGFVGASRGAVRLAGTDITKFAPHRRAHLGLQRTWQSLELFADLTVRENLEVSAYPTGWLTVAHDLVRPNRHRGFDAVDAAIDVFDLGAVANRYPAELSLGQRKLVGVARSLSACPSMILLDEPAAGLDTEESAALGLQLKRAVEQGVGLLLIDHDMGLVLGICEHVYVLEFGRIIASGAPSAIRVDDRVIGAYLGHPGATASVDAGSGA
jgi:branched-chain amino acid transport system ATP-binding protein